MSKDVTFLVDFESNDDECLPITKCVCGETFPAWDFIISIYPENAYECPKCNRKLFFSNSIRIYEVE
jgi:DNA-directed RNA polymerase subunit RPC12/RpoP